MAGLSKNKVGSFFPINKNINLNNHYGFQGTPTDNIYDFLSEPLVLKLSRPRENDYPFGAE